VEQDEGPRAGTSKEVLRPVFEAGGSVISRKLITSDGAAFVLVMSEEW
jgi:acetyl-CoA acetyltransferase